MCAKTYIPTYMHTITYTHTYIHTYVHTVSQSDGQTNRQTYGRTGRQTDAHTHTYVVFLQQLSDELHPLSKQHFCTAKEQMLLVAAPPNTYIHTCIQTYIHVTCVRT